MLSKTQILAVLAYGSSLTAGHMLMSSPVPYGKSTLNNSPLAADGSDFPCKQRAGVYDLQGASNVMALGSDQQLALVGSATHGGGSCQISITYDAQPDKNSVWKVIHSIEGGCPVQGVAGNNPANPDATNPPFAYKIPADIPTGSGTIAWTWFNKIGNREMYMNCAPVTLTGGGGAKVKRSERLQARQQAAYNNLPNMFTANFPAANCQVGEGTDVAFPDPGDSMVQLGLATQKPAAPTGAGCGVVKQAATDSATQVASDSSTTAAASVSAPVSNPSGGFKPGVFITNDGPGSAAATGIATSSVSQASAVPSTPAVPVTDPIIASTGNSSSSSGTTTTSSTTSAGALDGACTTEGMWNCIDGQTFQRCASGQWSTVQQMASGTSCTAGQSMTFAVVTRDVVDETA